VAINAECEAIEAATATDRGKKWRRRRIVALMDPEWGMGIAAAPKGMRLSSAIPVQYLFEAQGQLREELKNEEQETKIR
jgi:hypothetical protein